MQRKVLVTGGAGFIGSAVCRHLVGAGACRAQSRQAHLRRQSAASLAAIDNAPSYRFAKVDICDRARDDRGVRDLRARRRDPSRRRNPRRPLDRRPRRVHPDQHRRHVHAARGGARLLAGAAGGDGATRSASSTSPPTRSTARLGPTARSPKTTPYAPKLALFRLQGGADHLVRAWRRTYGLPVVISNCSNNYGPCQFPEKLIPLMILNALRGQAAAGLRRRARTCATGCMSRTTPGAADCRARRASRRDLQHRRPQRADATSRSSSASARSSTSSAADGRARTKR